MECKVFQALFCALLPPLTENFFMNSKYKFDNCEKIKFFYVTSTSPFPHVTLDLPALPQERKDRLG